MDLIFHNKGRLNEHVEVWIDSKPKGQKARIKIYRFTVMGAHVPIYLLKHLLISNLPCQILRVKVQKIHNQIIFKL